MKDNKHGEYFALGKLYLHKVWSKVVNHRAKGESIAPGGSHILYVDARVSLGYPPTPELEGFGTPSFAHGFLTSFSYSSSYCLLLFILRGIPRRF